MKAFDRRASAQSFDNFLHIDERTRDEVALDKTSEITMKMALSVLLSTSRY